MTERTRILVLTLIMITVCVISSGFAIAILYHTHIGQTKERLMATAQSQARLMEAMARFDIIESADYPSGALAATLSQILDAYEHYSLFGETGEFTLASRDGDNIRFQFTHGHSVLDRPEVIPFDSQLAEPMRRALKGLSGTLVGLDYRGEKVVAAYEPVAVLDMGIVAKIDLKEVRAPFVKAGFAAGCVTLVAVLVSTLLFSRISNPLLMQLKANSHDLQMQLEEREHLARFPSENRSPVLRVGAEGVLLYANPASEELLRDWSCEVEETVPEYWKRVSQDALEKNAEQIIECDLADRTLSFVIAPVAGSGYVNLYGRDITDRKKAQEEAFNAQQKLLDRQRHETEHAEAELAKVREELVRSTRFAAIGQVSASIAHDLRNPLGTVRNAAYLLKRRLPKDHSKLLDYTDIIDQEVSKADQIITNLLGMVRTRPPQKCLVDLDQIIKEVEQARKSEGVTCRVSADPDPFVVQADKGQLRQVIDNIFINSVYAMEGEGSFFVEASRDSEYDTVVFRDTGPGFAPEVMDRLFEPLVTTKASGIGLGLTICHQIIEKHGGTIEVDEHSPRGAIIRIRLPRG